MRLGCTLRLVTPLALILAGSLATAGAAEADTCEAATRTPGWHNGRHGRADTCRPTGTAP